MDNTTSIKEDISQNSTNSLNYLTSNDDNLINNSNDRPKRSSIELASILNGLGGIVGKNNLDSTDPITEFDQDWSYTDPGFSIDGDMDCIEPFVEVNDYYIKKLFIYLFIWLIKLKIL